MGWEFRRERDRRREREFGVELVKALLVGGRRKR